MLVIINDFVFCIKNVRFSSKEIQSLNLKILPSAIIECNQYMYAAKCDCGNKLKGF